MPLDIPYLYSIVCGIAIQEIFFICRVEAKGIYKDLIYFTIFFIGYPEAVYFGSAQETDVPAYCACFSFNDLLSQI